MGSDHFSHHFSEFLAVTVAQEIISLRTLCVLITHCLSILYNLTGHTIHHIITCLVLTDLFHPSQTKMVDGLRLEMTGRHSWMCTTTACKVGGQAASSL